MRRTQTSLAVAHLMWKPADLPEHWPAWTHAAHEANVLLTSEGGITVTLYITPPETLADYVRT